MCGINGMQSFLYPAHPAIPLSRQKSPAFLRALRAPAVKSPSQSNTMKHIAPLLFCFLTLLATGCTIDANVQVDRPNIILIMTDDQGYGDIAALGNPILQTPHMDALYAQSVRLTDFHVDPTCSPTRAALLTGRYSMRTGVWHTIQGRSMMSPDETTLAEVLQEAGYATGMFGKWHLGDAYPCRPEDQGFETVLTHGGGGLGNLPDYWGNDYFDDHYRSNTEGWQQYPGYCTDVWFEQATQWIDANKDEPFFCYLPTNAPHSPYLAPDSYVQPYKEAGVPSPAAEFYGMITCIDDNLGRLMAYLDEQGLAQNTIVIFMSDNGSASGHTRYDDFVLYNAGMRAFKGSQYDGGHRVPCFVRWPAGGIGGDEVEARDVEALTAHLDWMPTLLQLCGIEREGETQYDGQSIAMALQGWGEAPTDRTLIVQSQRIEQPAMWRKCAMLTDRYRLVNGRELYDIEADPAQQHDLAKDQPEMVAQLRSVYEDWWAELNAELVDVAYVMGDDAANPTTLTTHDLHHDEPGHDGAPWHQVHAQRNNPAAGFFWVDVAQPGRYRFTLRRFPAEHGGATGAVSALVTVGGQQVRVECNPESTSAAVDLELIQGGRTQLRAALINANGEAHVAFFVEIERLE